MAQSVADPGECTCGCSGHPGVSLTPCPGLACDRVWGAAWCAVQGTVSMTLPMRMTLGAVGCGLVSGRGHPRSLDLGWPWPGISRQPTVPRVILIGNVIETVPCTAHRVAPRTRSRASPGAGGQIDAGAAGGARFFFGLRGAW